MKKILLIILLFGITNIVFCQSREKKVEEFFEIIKCKELLNQGFNRIRSVIDSNKERLFAEYEIDFNNKEDIKEFDSFLNKEIEFFKKETYVYISAEYSKKYPNEKIQEFIELANNEESKTDVLEESNFKKELDSILKYQSSYLQNDVHLELTRIRAKHKPLILKIIQDGKETSISDLNLDLLLNTNDENKSQFSILNKSNSEISLPENFDFEKATSLTIKLNDENYIIERYNMNLPEMVRKVTSPLTLAGFEDLEYWTLTITDEKITLKIKAEVNIGR